MSQRPFDHFERYDLELPDGTPVEAFKATGKSGHFPPKGGTKLPFPYLGEREMRGYPRNWYPEPRLLDTDAIAPDLRTEGTVSAFMAAFREEMAARIQRLESKGGYKNEASDLPRMPEYPESANARGVQASIWESETPRVIGFGAVGDFTEMMGDPKIRITAIADTPEDMRRLQQGEQQ